MQHPSLGCISPTSSDDKGILTLTDSEGSITSMANTIFADFVGTPDVGLGGFFSLIWRACLGF